MLLRAQPGNVLILVVGGDDDHLRFGTEFANPTRSSNAIDLTWHFQIHEHDVRLVLLDGCEGRSAGIGFGHHLNIPEGV